MCTIKIINLNLKSNKIKNILKISEKLKPDLISYVLNGTNYDLLNNVSF